MVGFLLAFSMVAQSEDLRSHYKQHWEHRSLTGRQIRLLERWAEENQPPEPLTPKTLTWSPMGERYAISMSQGEPQAIYDLSYLNPLQQGQFRRVLLGTLGIGSFNLGDFLKAIKSRLDHMDAPFHVRQAVRLLSPLGGLDLTPRLPEGWQEKLGVKTLSGPIPLSSVNLYKMSSNPRKLQVLLEKAQEHFQSALDLPIPLDFFSGFELELTPQGGAEVFFVGYEEVDTASRKVVDFEASQNSYWRAVRLILFRQALRSAVSLIPEPVTNRLLTFIVNRWYRFFSQQITSRHASALGLLNLAHLGDPHSPFAALSEEKAYEAGTYLSNFELNPLDALALLFSNREHTWSHRLEDLHERKVSGEAYLRDQGFNLLEINPLMAFAVRGESALSIYAPGSTSMIMRRPLELHNYQAPTDAIHYRSMVGFIDDAMALVDIPLPFANQVLRALLRFFVQQDILHAQEWEAMLMASLRNRASVYEEDWGEELDWLARRRLNPFELNPEEERELIERRRQRLGI